MQTLNRKYQKYRFLLFIIICLQTGLFAYSGGVFYGFQLPYLDLSNTNLNYHYGGVYTYTITPGRQHMGWFAGFMISTVAPAEQVFGSLYGGILLAQEIKVGIFSLTFSAWPGMGISVSDLGAYPAHLYLTGEAQVGLGFYLSEWMQVNLYSTLRGFTNLFPLIPFQEYALYSTTVGLKITWHG